MTSSFVHCQAKQIKKENKASVNSAYQKGPGCHRNKLITFVSDLFQAFCAKTAGSHMTLRKLNSGTESGRELFKGSKDSASLVVCNEKKLFGWGLWIL